MHISQRDSECRLSELAELAHDIVCNLQLIHMLRSQSKLQCMQSPSGIGPKLIRVLECGIAPKSLKARCYEVFLNVGAPISQSMRRLVIETKSPLGEQESSLACLCECKPESQSSNHARLLIGTISLQRKMMWCLCVTKEIEPTSVCRECVKYG